MCVSDEHSGNRRGTGGAGLGVEQATGRSQRCPKAAVPCRGHGGRKSADLGK